MNTLADIFTCPVCLEKFDDPRILNCGHHFCCQCLISIYDRDCMGAIPCPSCRKETELKSLGKHVTDLPRPVMVIELQELLGKMFEGGDRPTGTASPSQPSTGKLCDLCSTIGAKHEQPASWYCYQCKYRLCETCCEKHKASKLFSSHVLKGASDSLFCATHPKEVYTAFCESCQTTVCNVCVHSEDHAFHEVVEIQEKSASQRESIEVFIEKQSKLKIGSDVFKNITTRSAEANEGKVLFKNYLSNTKSLLKSMYDIVCMKEGVLEKELEEQHERITRKCEQMIKIDTVRSLMIDFGTKVKAESSGADLITEVPCFPQPSEVTDLKVSYDVFIPTLQPSATQLLQQLATMKNYLAESMFGHYEHVSSEVVAQHDKFHKLGQMPDYDWPFKRKCSIFLASGISGLTFDVLQKRLLIRTRDLENPIKVYDYDGIKITEFGSGIQGLDQPGLLTADAEFQLYLAPAGDRIITIDPDGLESVPVISKQNVVDPAGNAATFQGAFGLGVPQMGQNPMEREFAITGESDTNHNKIAFFRLKRGKAIEQPVPVGIGEPGKEYKRPSYIKWCEHDGEPGFAYSDQMSDHIGIVSPDGIPKRRYGSSGTGPGLLRYPAGVCGDRRGRVLVSDWGNSRVTAFWTEDDTEKWECLIGRDTLGGQPYDLAYDVIQSEEEVHEVLAVELEDRVDIYCHVERQIEDE